MNVIDLPRSSPTAQLTAAATRRELNANRQHQESLSRADLAMRPVPLRLALALLVLCAALVGVVGARDALLSRIYTILDAKPCVRLLTKHGVAGCSSTAEHHALASLCA